ncbi:uncharacterized protein LOC111117117 isoform X2 [Crassostrea virginica]
MAVGVLFVLAINIGYLLIRETNTLENLALNPDFKGIPTQSTSYIDDYHAENAVNGKFYEEGDKSACSFTVANLPRWRAWWKLPLKKLSNVAYLQIYFRESTVNRHVGFSVYVFNESHFVPPSTGSGYTVFSHNTTTCPHRVMNITVNRLTKGIALYNAKDSPVNASCPGYTTFTTFEVCEVQVLGCCNKDFQDVCQPCDPKCFNNLCASHNGSCIYGCSNDHKKAPNCTNCIIGNYGKDCHRRCGHCKNGTHCDISSGKCPEGCEEHWNGSLCDSSMKCSHCKMGTNCNNTTSICEAGCQEHWGEPKCDVCQDGYYGEECKFSCDKCKNEAFCDNTTGDCHNGCQENWLGSRCDIRKKGICGSNCTQLCDLCRNESVCYNITGECSQGCKDHWNGSRDDGFYSIIANAILAFLLAVTIALIVFQRRRISALQYDRQMMDQHHIYQGENRSHNYDNLGVLEETHEYTCLDSARELHFQDSSVL